MLTVVWTMGGPHRLNAISTGGGMFYVDEIDGHAVHMAGDFFETLAFLGSEDAVLLAQVQAMDGVEEAILHGCDSPFIQIKSCVALGPQNVEILESHGNVNLLRVLKPVLPVLPRRCVEVPFITCDEMLAYNKSKDLALWELALHYESARGSITHEQVFDKLRIVVDVMRRAIASGIAGTSYDDRILPSQAPIEEASPSPPPPRNSKIN